MIVMPGLVNAHYHSYSTVLKGTENSLPLEAWALYTVAYGRALGEEAIRLAVLLGAAEMLRSGVTACLDHFPHVRWADAALAAHEASGMRVGFAPFMHDRLDHELLEVPLPPEIRRRLDAAPRSDPAGAEQLYRDLVARWHGRAGRLSVLLGPNAFQRCSPALWGVWRRLADELGLAAHTHLAETRAQGAYGQRRWPGGTVAEMDRQGLLSERLSVAHGIWLSAARARAAGPARGDGRAQPGEQPDARQRAAAPGGRPGPGGAARPRHRLVQHRRPAFALRGDAPGPDAPASGHAGPAGLAPARPGPRPGDARRRARPRAGRNGRRAGAGHRADLVLLDPRTAALGGGAVTVPQLVQHAGPEAVAAVMVGGRWVLRDRRILAFDEAAVLDRLAALGPELLAAARPDVDLARAVAGHFTRV